MKTDTKTGSTLIMIFYFMMMNMVIPSTVINWLINQIWLYIYYFRIKNKAFNDSIFRNSENYYRYQSDNYWIWSWGNSHSQIPYSLIISSLLNV